MLNHVQLIGNLTRDAETSTGPATTMTRLRLATSAVWRDADGNRQESTEYHAVVLFGRLAETVGAWCVKGRRLYVAGRLRTREYEGSDGLRRHSTEVVAETVRFLDRAPGEGDDHAAAAPHDPDPMTIGHEQIHVEGEGEVDAAARVGGGAARRPRAMAGA